MITLRDIEKALYEIQHPFMIKTLNKLGTEGCTLIKATAMTTYDKVSTYNKFTANIIINSEKLKPFPPRSGT